MLFTTPHAEIKQTSWSITDDTRAAAEVESRQNAMRAAVQKANDYAGVLGRTVFATEVKDQGSYSRGRTKQTARVAVTSRKRAHVDGLALEPEDVELSTTLAVKFVSE